MQGAAFFATGRGGTEEKKLGWGGRGKGLILGAGRGGATVKLRAFSGRAGQGTGSLENFRGQGGQR